MTKTPDTGTPIIHPSTDIPVRAPSATSADDTVLPFEVSALDLRGRVVRLGPVVDDILQRHDYPLPVAKLLGEVIALTALLGSALKFDGRFILQTQTDGAVRMLVVDYRSPGKLRAYARYDAARVEQAVKDGEASPGALLGRGHLAMTVDQGDDMSRYQGLVALEGGSLEDAAHEYFRSSEQIPTRVRLAVAEEFSAGGGRRWRAGGMLLQFLPRAPERMHTADIHAGDAPEGTVPHSVAEDDAWVEGRSLIETVEDLELIDPSLSSERLVYRLFHERGVRVFKSVDVLAECSCSAESVEAMLRSFSQDDRDHMVENDAISVTCEFCNAKYRFAPESLRDAPVENAAESDTATPELRRGRSPG